LVAYREEVARGRTRQFAAQTYWGRPVPGFGDPHALMLLVGLAPAAHGGNRTGRMFTGDGSGDFLTPALHRAGLANQPASVSRHDGLRLRGLYMTASARCAPPDNRPLPSELRNCRPYLLRELELLTRLRVVVALGHIAFTTVLRSAVIMGWSVPKPRPAFGHGVEAVLRRSPATHARRNEVTLIASYHPSRQNTNTGRLTPAMLDHVLGRATVIAGLRR
jgi:uracil-DNA glycosylase family 4